MQYLIDTYPMLSGHPVSEYIYWELNGIKTFPICQGPGCGNYVKFINVRDGYRKCCSISCSNRSANHIDSVKSAIDTDPIFWKKRTTASKQTKLDRYGDENYCNTEKAKNTRYLKNGGRYHAVDFIQKTKSAKKDRYGDENYCNIEKTKKTVRQRSEDDPDYYIKRNDKAKKTSLILYGDENYRNSEKAADTDRLHHAGVFHTQTDKFRSTAARRRRRKTYDKLVLDSKKELLMSFEEFEAVSANNGKLKYRCRKCRHTFEIQHHIGNHFLYLYNDCPLCFPKIYDDGISKKEKDFVDFLRSQNIVLYENTRSVIRPLELDVYVPSRQTAFEFDGLYWHSEINKPDKNYHLLKTELCENNGIRLIHIFENEWISKQDIVKSRVKDILGIHSHVIFARNCTISEVDSCVSTEFLEKNHIQGAVGASVRLGLYFKNELVALMTFGKPRFTGKYEWELLRFCCKLGCHIPGAAGKLLKHFENTCCPKSLVSYADRRWSQGGLYKALGFRLDHASPPDYWYWNRMEFGSRVNYQKHKLKKILKQFDDSKTEVQNMYDNGYNRIFDCGNLVFSKEYAEFKPE